MDKTQFIKDFESMREIAELKSLSSYSLENTLNDTQFKRMIELKQKYFK